MPDRPFADPIDPVPGGLDLVQTIGRFVSGGIALWVALLLSLLFTGATVGETGFGPLMIGLIAIGLPVGLAGLLFDLASRLRAVWRPAHKPFPWRTLVLVAGALALLGIGTVLGAFWRGLPAPPSAAARILVLSVAATPFTWFGVLSLLALDPGQGDTLQAQLAKRAATRAPVDGTPPCALGPVTAVPGGMIAPIAWVDRAGTLRVDLSRLPVVVEVALPVAGLPPGLQATHPSVASPDTAPLGDPILDGRVAVTGPEAARRRLLRDRGALLALLQGWPGSSVEEDSVVLRFTQPEGRLEADRLLDTLDQATPALLDLAAALDADPTRLRAAERQGDGVGAGSAAASRNPEATPGDENGFPRPNPRAVERQG